ncbi:MAG TPA: methyltransferase [Bacteroidia bacterium]|nr:methyltransferase [Bacteroidia bacterium]
MKVGTDAVLLGAWVRPNGAKRILDIGTGTGIIALMIAQRSAGLIDGIDIDDLACLQAQENVALSPWKERVRILHHSLQEYSEETSTRYDLVVSNPPYFLDSSKANGLERTTARHADLLPYRELIDSVIRLLDKKGKFCVILPVKEAAILRELANEKGLQLSKLMRVRTKADQETEKRHIMQFEFAPSSFSEETIVIEKDERHEYTEEYKELTRDYYLGF